MKSPKMPLKSLLIIIFAWWQVALSQTISISAPPPTASGCVASGAFSACIQLAASDFTNCDAAALNLPTDYDRENAELACYGLHLEEQLNCYLSSCWNEVYSCGYQWIASEFYVNYVVPQSLVSQASIPFYPAPDNAPGGCSCNVGKLSENVTSALEEQESICGARFYNPSDLGGCFCCAASAAIAAFYAFCPTTDENDILLPAYISAIQDGILSQCSGLYDAATCEDQYGLAPAAGGLALSINNLPAWTGTNPLSTFGGTIASPLGGSVLAWMAPNFVYTITAAAAPLSSPNGGGVSSTTTKPALSSASIAPIASPASSSASTGPTTSPVLSSTGTGTTTQAQTTAPPVSSSASTGPTTSPASSSTGTVTTIQAQTTAPPATTTTQNGLGTKAKIDPLLWILSLGRLVYIIIVRL